jgi:hypothetical protein
MDFKYGVVLLSCICISFLYGLSILSHPAAIELSEMSNNDGKNVLIQGVVTDFSTTTYGNQIITLSDIQNTNTTITVFIEGTTLVNYGDTIQAEGTVQKYQGKPELVVNNPRCITLLKAWQNTTYPIRQLAEQPQKYVGFNVHVYGEVEKTYPDYFYLTDSETQYLIPVYSNSFTNVSAGDEISLGARFIYDQTLLRYTFTLNEEQHFIKIMNNRGDHD